MFAMSREEFHAARVVGVDSKQRTRVRFVHKTTWSMPRFWRKTAKYKWVPHDSGKVAFLEAFNIPGASFDMGGVSAEACTKGENVKGSKFHSELFHAPDSFSLPLSHTHTLSLSPSLSLSLFHFHTLSLTLSHSLSLNLSLSLFLLRASENTFRNTSERRAFMISFKGGRRGSRICRKTVEHFHTGIVTERLSRWRRGRRVTLFIAPKTLLLIVQHRVH